MAIMSRERGNEVRPRIDKRPPFAAATETSPSAPFLHQEAREKPLYARAPFTRASKSVLD